ncbi:uncharacterized protein METZ01_LOCUS323517, partial [marine metagenome]
NTRTLSFFSLLSVSSSGMGNAWWV